MPNKDTVQDLIKSEKQKGHKILDNISVNTILNNFGISTPPASAVATLEQAEQFAKEVSYPVVLKVSTPGLLHKAELGCVVNDVTSAKELEKAWYTIERKITQLEPDVQKNAQVMIQKDIEQGVEIKLRVTRHPILGEILRLGGDETDITEDNYTPFPLDLASVESLIRKSKHFSLLMGRGDSPEYSLKKLYELMVAVGDLLKEIPDAIDIGVDPVIVKKNATWVVDGEIVLKDGERPKPKGPTFKHAKTLSNTVLATTYHYTEHEPEEPLEFKPGQYISVKVADTAVRSYSVATREGTSKFGLLVDVKPGGPGSKFFESLKKGDDMIFLGPFGKFVLNQEDGSEHIVLMGTGSGLSPLRCMVDAALVENTTDTPISLYIGFRFPEDVFWGDYFKELADKNPNFNYKIAVSKPNDSWNGYKGYITDLVREDFADASKCSVYLCGNPHMIADGKEIMATNGCLEERIYTEKFI